MEKNVKLFHYVLKKKYQNFGNEAIKNNKGQTIAKVKFPLYSSSHLVEIQDLIKQSTYFIEIQRGFFHKNYKFRDSSNILAKIKISKILLSANKAYLLINKTKKKFLTVGNFKKWTYNIINKTSNQVIGSVIDLKRSALKIFNDKVKERYYCLKLKKYDEYSIIILGFVLCINNLNYKGISNIAGFERRIARLRPFGPGEMKK
ncbi:MAG: hypothetical protein ACFFB1_15870 [Promethearchaeota archaeon]